jgi:hypothetical protein
MAGLPAKPTPLARGAVVWQSTPVLPPDRGEAKYRHDIARSPCPVEPGRHRLRFRHALRPRYRETLRRLDRFVSCHHNPHQRDRFPTAAVWFRPPRAVGTLSLVLLAFAVLALYTFHLAGAWRWIYVVTAIASLYLNVFVGVIQAFLKVPAIHDLAPTQTEPPFLIAQGAVLLLFVVLGVMALKKFHPGHKPGA